jgi:hypothetical protein
MWKDIIKADITTTRVELINYDDDAYEPESDVDWSYNFKESEGGLKLDIEVHSFTNFEEIKEIWDDKFHSLELTSWDDFSNKYAPIYVELNNGKYKIIFG